MSQDPGLPLPAAVLAEIPHKPQFVRASGDEPYVCSLCLVGEEEHVATVVTA